MLVLYLLLVLYSATDILSTAARVSPCFLGVPLALVVPLNVHDVLCLGDTFGKDLAFTRSGSIR